MALTRDFQLLIAVVAVIAGVAGALAFRGWWRLVALVAGLLVAWYFFVLPDIRI